MLRFEKLSDYKKYRKGFLQEESLCQGSMEMELVYDLFLMDCGEICGVTTELFITDDDAEAETFRKRQEEQMSDLIAHDYEPCEYCGPYLREMWDTQGGRIIILYTIMKGKAK